MKMKRKLKVSIAVALVLVMLVSILPLQLAAETMTHPVMRYATPDGYNDHDYQKMVNFLEQTDENGVKNGDKLSDDYDPTDPETWHQLDYDPYEGYDVGRGWVDWTTVGDEYRVCEIFFWDQ